MTITLSLPPQLEELVQQKVASGNFANASEVIEAALRQMDEHDRLTELRASLAIAEAQIARGEGRLYTPELREEMKQNALRKAREGRKPKADVLP